VTRLLLASASPARRATLTAAGIVPLVRVSGVDEDAALAAATERFGTLEPADAVLVLAQAKAEAVARTLRTEPADDDVPSGDLPSGELQPDDDADNLLVLGCDSMLELDGEIHGKPADADRARAAWRAMRGRTGVLHTGHWLIDERDPAAGGTGGTLGATSSTVVHFADLSDAEIDAYVATGEPLAVAGAFTVDGLGGPFVTGLEGDHHGVVGVSLPLLRELLAQVGLTVPDLWSLSGGDNAD
jgi:septum formation protein